MSTLLDRLPASAGKSRHTVTVALEGETLAIPVLVARGKRPGPVLALLAGEHGVEVNGIAAIDRVFREVSCAELCGTLVAVAAVSPTGVHARRLVRGDEWDTFCRWPGAAGGPPAERITAALSAAVVDAADALVNIHAWSWYASSCAFAWRQDPLAVRLAQGFALPFVDFSFPKYCKGRDTPLHPRHNQVTHYVSARGKSAILVELRTHHWQFPESVSAGIRGLRNAMVSLGMLPGVVAPPAGQFESTGKEEFAHASRAGLYVPLKDIGAAVRQGELLGYLLDLETGRRTRVLSPCDGGVWLNSRVGPGEATLTDMHSYAARGDLLALIKHVKPAVVPP